jgi:Fe2+ or Zn2+ uptake regulation protein
MITNKNELLNILAAREVKPTFQRLTILGAVMDTRIHPTIRSLHRSLVKKVPTLSKTTLYSTLELFAAKGLVSTLTIDPAEVRYDGLLSPHHHFVCSVCGCILDIDITCDTGRKGELHGHRIDEVHGYFKGVCRSCRAKLPASPSPVNPKNIHQPRRKTHA